MTVIDQSRRSIDPRTLDGQVPACMLWPVPDDRTMSIELEHDDLISPRMLAWQDGRCAICGSSSRGYLVVDHCHVFGHVRGMLCRPCNGLEGTSDGTQYVRYRSGWNPATLLGYHTEYVNPVTGQLDLSPDGEWLRMTPQERAAYEQRLVDIVAGLPSPGATSAGWAS